MTLDEVIEALELAPHEIQAFDPAFSRFSAQRPLLVLPAQFEAARVALAERYPAEHPARVLRDRGGVVEEAVGELDLDARAWLVEPLAVERDVRSLEGLRGVMERLFGPDGCPWDREQTHETLRSYFLEEAYELVDAIDRNDMAGLREELGDLFAHLFMQTALAQQSGEFTLEDVAESGTAKMVRRHPHVFGDEVAGSQEALLARWDEIKAAERAEKGGDARAHEGALASVPLAAPALQRAQILLRRARRSGLAEPPEDPRTRLRVAVEALPDAPDTAAVAAVLLAAVDLAREAGVDAEEALRERAHRFTERFEALERRAAEAGTDIASLDERTRLEPWEA